MQDSIRIFPALNLSFVKQPGLILHSLVYEKICPNSFLCDKQIKTLRSSRSWNGFPSRMRNFMISKLKAESQPLPTNLAEVTHLI